ncbi:uncharacterized protein TNCV_869461 [Trichonephila clavipes]|nr:uncharacterized protein TNCV_869461 [Trichonephila clavipes]
MKHSISEIVRLLGFSRSTVSRVYQEYMDGEQKTSDRANCKGKLALIVRGERRLRRNGVLLEHCLGSLVRVLTSLSVIRYVELLGDHFHPLMLFWAHGNGDFQQGNSTTRVKGHHTAPTNLTELWTTFANIWQVISVERFQELVNQPMSYEVQLQRRLLYHPLAVGEDICRIQSLYSLKMGVSQ